MERMGPLSGVKVVDVSTVVAGPGCARYLADFGADVIKVERPDGGDGVRRMGAVDPSEAEPTSLWWRLIGRNKRTIDLDLKDEADRAVFAALCDGADVLVENFRPGTLERLGFAPVDLIARNPRLVVVRVTGYGQDGPYKDRPGFATQAEAMGGWAAISGEPDGKPLLPPVALTDEVTALAAAFATMVALHSGVGQEVDVNLLETMIQLMGPLVPLYGVHGEVQPRLGAGIPYTVPRNTYRCADGRWVAVSTSAESVARRVMELVGCGEDPRFATFAGRVEHREEIDARMAAWIGARTEAEVLDAFEAAEAACAPVNDMAAIFADAHVTARGTIVELDGTPMPGLLARMSATPGSLRHAGRPADADGADIRAVAAPVAGFAPTARLVFERGEPVGDQPGEHHRVASRDTGATVGSARWHRQGDTVEVGWALQPECRGRGLATELGAALLARARREGLRAVEAVIEVGNGESDRVAERLGLVPVHDDTCRGAPARRWRREL